LDGVSDEETHFPRRPRCSEGTRIPKRGGRNRRSEARERFRQTHADWFDQDRLGQFRTDPETALQTWQMKLAWRLTSLIGVLRRSRLAKRLVISGEAVVV
jgi:hypothetical protein